MSERVMQENGAEALSERLEAMLKERSISAKNGKPYAP